MLPQLFLALSAVQVGGQLLAGVGAKQEADLNVYNMETEKIQNKTLAMQQAQARRDEYDLATSANIAAFYASGQDAGSSMSVKAFLERQKEIAAQDLGRIATQEQTEAMRIDFAKGVERRSGQNALMSSIFNAAGTAGSSLFQYQQIKV